MADQIIGMYAFGTSTREISRYFEREFDTKLSADTISAITDRVLPEIKEWKSRTLDPVYAICWLDAIHYKVKDDTGRAVTRAIYNVLGINKEGHKELLGMYVAKSEGANFWLEVLTDLQNRGVEDIMICCVDGLKGFPDEEPFWLQSYIISYLSPNFIANCWEMSAQFARGMVHFSLILR